MGSGSWIRQAGGGAPPGRRLVSVGSLRQRAAVGHGAGGLQRRRRGVGLPAPRSRPVTGLPLGRGRPGRVLRRGAAAVPGPGPVERPGPDPEGAGLRPDRGPGQSRRGCQGVLVVPRCRPEPRLESLALPLPTGRLSVPEPSRREQPAGQDRPGIRTARHRGVRRRPVLGHRGPLRQGRPPRHTHVDPDHQCRAGGRHPACAADRLVSQHLVVGCRSEKPELAAAGPAAVAIHHPFLGELELLAGPEPGGGQPELLFCDNETNHGRLYGLSPSPPYPKDGINDHVVSGAATVNPAHRHQMRGVVPIDGSPADRRVASTPAAPPARAPAAAAPSGPISTR